MQVFVTVGTGLIGSAVVAELVSNGHTALALARSDVSAELLTQPGPNLSGVNLVVSTPSAPVPLRPTG